MKKIIIFTFLAVIITTYSEVKEVVKNAEGKNVLLLTDNTWELEKEFVNVKEFESKVKVSNLEISAKRSDGRSLTGSVTNYSRKKLEYVTYSIKWQIEGQYSVLNVFTIKDLNYKETRDFNRRIKLKGIPGRNYKLEVVDFKWEN